MKKETLFSLLMSLLLIACSADFFDKPIDVDIQENESKLAPTAIFGFINEVHEDDYYQKVMVSYSQSPFQNPDEELQIIEDATVELVGNETTFSFEFNEFDNFYYPSENITFYTSQNYTLTISAPNKQTVVASQTLPEPVEIINIENTGNHLLIKINDNPNARNFYLLQAYKNYGEDNTQIVWLEPFATYMKESSIFYSNILFADTSFNGEQDFEIDVKHNEENDGTGNYKIVLYTVTEDFFKYDTSIRIAEYAEDNPFVEPVIIHNNFENGYGIFTLMNKTEFNFSF